MRCSGRDGSETGLPREAWRRQASLRALLPGFLLLERGGGGGLGPSGLRKLAGLGFRVLLGLGFKV